MAFLNSFVPVARVVAKIYAPFVEVIIHDLDNQKVHHVEGNLSKLNTGDLSKLEENLDILEASIERCTSPQVNKNGRLIKTISTILVDQKGDEKGLMCINFDVSKLVLTQEILTELLAPQVEAESEEMFKNDWQDQIHLFIHKFLDENKLNLEVLNTKQKKELVYGLFNQGAFNATNSANYIAGILNMGRATIFNYLKEWRAA
ncbi:helix-turn-helix transcriptional regulator [Candidatus Paracaedibacter symbiosus]|uniref:helix-turn-helix transcriptional regulator n=1 Tax=Candidatus Paracaedibacter symbiosus TaxID=244582 RepID=UPI000509F15B|nr:PAS domain-containing protein [Candidatus Paracaedibacter symbiosus]